MDSYSENNAAAVFDHCFSQLRDSTIKLLQNESHHCQEIQELKTDLNAFKDAYKSSENTKRELELQIENLTAIFDTEKSSLEAQIIALKSVERRVICLLDGDGTIFSTAYLVRGQDGGHDAARALSDTIRQELASSGLQYQLWVYVFYNKRGLMDTFGRAGLWEAKVKFEDFVVGFNQAAERFSMVDVGSGKEAADAKIKVYMEDTRLHQTAKLIFGGCHDNGYVTSLRSLITSGLRDKLIMLRGYNDMALGIEELKLPTISIPELFMIEKMIIPTIFNAPVPSGVVSVLARSKTRSCSVSGDVVSVETGTLSISEPKVQPPRYNSVSALNRTTAPPVPHTTYASALQAASILRDRPPTPDLDSTSDGSSSSDGSDNSVEDLRASPQSQMTRHVSSAIPLSKHKPPPCTLFYLADCRHGVNCKYAHNYILEDHHYEEIRRNAKSAPCPAINRGEECTWGDKCCYGHVCPGGAKCFYLKQGRCRFVGETMHEDTA